MGKTVFLPIVVDVANAQTVFGHVCFVPSYDDRSVHSVHGLPTLKLDVQRVSPFWNGTSPLNIPKESKMLLTQLMESLRVFMTHIAIRLELQETEALVGEALLSKSEFATRLVLCRRDPQKKILEIFRPDTKQPVEACWPMTVKREVIVTQTPCVVRTNGDIAQNVMVGDKADEIVADSEHSSVSIAAMLRTASQYA